MPPFFVIDALAVFFIWSAIGKLVIDTLFDWLPDALLSLVRSGAVLALSWAVVTYSSALWHLDSAVAGAVAVLLAIVNVVRNAPDEPTSVQVTRRTRPRIVQNGK